MKYKVISNGHKYKANGNYVFGENKPLKDQVLLTFDEENQVFKAQIINPSQHTQYLYSIGRLGIDLTRRTAQGRYAAHNGRNNLDMGKRTHPH